MRKLIVFSLILISVSSMAEMRVRIVNTTAADWTKNQPVYSRGIMDLTYKICPENQPNSSQCLTFEKQLCSNCSAVFDQAGDDKIEMYPVKAYFPKRSGKEQKEKVWESFTECHTTFDKRQLDINVSLGNGSSCTRKIY